MSHFWLASVAYFIPVRDDHRVGGFRSLKLRPSRGVWLIGRDSFTISISSISSSGCLPIISITNGSFHVGRDCAIMHRRFPWHSVSMSQDRCLVGETRICTPSFIQFDGDGKVPETTGKVAFIYTPGKDDRQIVCFRQCLLCIIVSNHRCVFPNFCRRSWLQCTLKTPLAVMNFQQHSRSVSTSGGFSSDPEIPTFFLSRM